MKNNALIVFTETLNFCPILWKRLIFYRRKGQTSRAERSFPSGWSIFLIFLVITQMKSHGFKQLEY